jgi:hypothetical protein
MSYRPLPPFFPEQGGTRPVLVGTSSARISLDNFDGRSLELYNSGTAVVFVQMGDVTVTASTGTASATTPTKGSYAVGPGVVVIISRARPEGGTYTHMAHISGTAAQTLYVTPGQGA